MVKGDLHESGAEKIENFNKNAPFDVNKYDNWGRE